MSMPKIDGHFWVERDGEIIDTDFPIYEECRRFWKCVSSTPHHLEADATTQKLMIEMFKRSQMKTMEVDTWEKCVEEVVLFTSMMGITTPQPNQCWMNAIIEVAKNGGKIKFGSLGWETKSGKIHWEYGGETYKNVKQFLA